MTQAKLYTESELGFERVFEIRIRDLRERKGIKQKSFSVSVKKGIKDTEYLTAEEMKNFLENRVSTK